MAKTRKRKVSRLKKWVKVSKRRYLKPFFYAVVFSFIIYMVVGNIIIYNKVNQNLKPNFVITRISDNFETTEFMYMLLVTQEIMKNDILKKDLIDFVNAPTAAHCSKKLELELLNMNWEKNAYYVRIRKAFELKDDYDRYLLLGQTAHFLEEEVLAGRLSSELMEQVGVLNLEREKVRAEFSDDAFEFIENYSGFLQQLIKL